MTLTFFISVHIISKLKGNIIISYSQYRKYIQVLLPAADCEKDSFCEEMAAVTTDDEVLDVGTETTTGGPVSDFEPPGFEVFMDELAAGGPEFVLGVVFPFVTRSRFPPPLPRCAKASWVLVAVTLISLA